MNRNQSLRTAISQAEREANEQVFPRPHTDIFADDRTRKITTFKAFEHLAEVVMSPGERNIQEFMRRHSN